jgi:uroporphyrinogen-III synthase
VVKTPSHFNAKSLASALGRLKGKRFCLPRVEGGPEDAVRALRARGAVVEEIAVYRTRPAAPPAPWLRRIIVEHADAVAFTSSSTVT